MLGTFIRLPTSVDIRIEFLLLWTIREDSVLLKVTLKIALMIFILFCSLIQILILTLTFLRTCLLISQCYPQMTGISSLLLSLEEKFILLYLLLKVRAQGLMGLMQNSACFIGRMLVIICAGNFTFFPNFFFTNFLGEDLHCLNPQERFS